MVGNWCFQAQPEAVSPTKRALIDDQVCHMDLAPPSGVKTYPAGSDSDAVVMAVVATLSSGDMGSMLLHE